MIQAATLDFDGVFSRMRAICARNAAPSCCWAITVPAYDEAGVAWEKVLVRLWDEAKRGTRLEALFEELAEMDDGTRVLVLIGVR